MSFGETFNIGGIVASVSNPTVTNVTSVSGNEGTSLVHTVTLSAATTASTDYTYSLSGGTATAGVDYTVPPTFSAGVTLSGGTLTVPSGVSVFNVTVAALSDGSSESSETYNLTIGGITGVGTISDAGGGTLTATRSTGTAPLGVSFEVTGNGEFNDSRTWDFGDTGAGTWAITGLSKNAETDGAVVAHVFETAGSYTVSVSGLTIGITVDDPNTVFSGANTICVSPSANYTGAPGGATLQTSLPSSYAGKRVLLHKGESFGSITPLNTDSNFQVGSYGTGAKPNVDGVVTGMVSGVASWTNNWTLMDLDLGFVNIDATTKQFTCLRCDMQDTGVATAQCNIGTSVGYYYATGTGPVPAAIYRPNEIFLVECNIIGVVQPDDLPLMAVMGYFGKSAILGCTIDRATEHSMRVWAGNRLHIGHSDIRGDHYAPGGIGIRHAIKIMAGGLQDYTDIYSTSTTPATSKITISSNLIGSAVYEGNWILQTAPQNSDTGTIEGLEDVLIVNNGFTRGPNTTLEIMMMGRRMTTRGNYIVGGGSVDISGATSGYDAGLSAWYGPYYAE